MSRTYRIIVDVEADEADRLLHTENLRVALADAADSQLTVARIRIDGREYDTKLGVLEETPINADIAQMIWSGQIIAAIRELRTLNPGMSLAEAKDLVDKWKANR